MNVTDFEKARALEDLWIRSAEEVFESGIPREEKVKARPITIAEAWRKFLGQARARKLSLTSIYKYDLLRRRMEDFAKGNRLFLLRDLNTDVLELFQNEFIGSDVTCSKALERLKAFCRAAFLRKWIDKNPAVTLRGPKPNVTHVSGPDPLFCGAGGGNRTPDLGIMRPSLCH
jgi:Phage integrase SAM-like domain